MTRELITTWEDYQTALERLLASAKREIRIYDEDLVRLHLDSPVPQAEIRRLLHATRHGLGLRIAIRNASHLQQRQTRLLQLFQTYGHVAAMQETPSHLAHLRDGMVLVDDSHALIRFERDFARSKLLIDEPDEIGPYANRFEEIWAQGGESPIGTTLGL